MSNTSTNSISRLLNDPLGHFLLGGLLIFVVVAALSPEDSAENNPNHIVIDRDVLLNQLQYRAKVFEPELAERKLDTLSDEDLETLISQYVHEEVLFREATSLGFGDNDYIIKKRMIQKMDFIIDGVSASAAEVSDADIQNYYEQNSSSYIEPGHVTFTHVFIDGEDRDPVEVEKLTQQTLAQLQADQASFIDAPRYGDRFPFGLNYVEKTRDLIASHFSPEMAATLFQLSPDANRWQGPFRSPYGQHIVMLTKRAEDRQQPLVEVREQVVQEVVNDKRQQQRQDAIEKLVEDYTVERRSLQRPQASEG